MNQNSKPISSFESNNIPVRRECYRSSTLGEALKQATLYMKKAGKLNDEMNAKIMAHFDVGKLVYSNIYLLLKMDKN